MSTQLGFINKLSVTTGFQWMVFIDALV
jgi:hypothetical protein